MCQVRFIGCLHLGHTYMAQHRGFHCEIEHDEWLIKKWNETTHKKDLTYILGDVTMESTRSYPLLDRLNGKKIVVLGNHDLPRHIRELLNYVDTVAGMVDYKGFALTHAPIHPNEIHFYRGNIHAHIHENALDEVFTRNAYLDKESVISPSLYKYYNVDALRIGFKPKTIEELLNSSL
jgi:calcineurin-like phosphoesterase family protein